MKATGDVKICCYCRAELPTTEFHRNRNLSDGLAGRCKPCNNDYKKRWRKKNPELNKLTKGTWKPIRRFRKYGITPCDFTRMRIERGDRCDVCGTVYPKLAIDHDHETGRVRGLLCLNCNTGLGQFRDSVELLNAAIRYLDR